ncbi:MAG: helix-turn-helix domain-containing protein [Bacteroidetes bacterium]|nr:helix-turn-helix domain-containing protein [Bacteroidota bacterium]
MINRTIPKGILNQPEGLRPFKLQRFSPSPGLCPFIEHYWQVSWDLTGQKPVTQEVVSHPSVHLTAEDGIPWLYGVVPVRYTKELTGKGSVFGIKFTPGGFFPFNPVLASELTGKRFPAGEFLDGPVLEWAKFVETDPDPGNWVRQTDLFLQSFSPVEDSVLRMIADVFSEAIKNPAMVRAEDLAAVAEVSLRHLERVFRQRVGVSPKWVINRYRMHEILALLDEKKEVNWTQFALELGYFDQAHFSREFKKMTGYSPGKYPTLK